MTTKEQLFAGLENDDITVDVETVNKANNGDGNAMWNIGFEYYSKQQYDKAMAWYRLAADKNNLKAQNNIGFLYLYGLGVPGDYLLALEWFLKSAIQNDKTAWVNIGLYFENGYAVPVDKYKALEWCYKCNSPMIIKEWGDQGIQLTQQDKNKSIEQLVMETEELAWPEGRSIKEKRLAEEINTLKQLMNKMEEESRAKNNEISLLKEENQTLRLTSERQQQELNVKQESIDQYKRKEQTINSELQALKQENHTLKLKLEEEARARNDEINSSKEEVQTFRVIAEDKQQEINSFIESINQYKQKEQTLNSELQSLKQANHTLELKMKAKDNKVVLLEKEMKRLRIASENSSQGTTERVKELKKSNQGLESMLKQERQLKDGQIEVMKGKMEISLEKEKQKRKHLEKENRAMKRELKSMKILTQKKVPSKQASIKSEKDENNNTDSSDNETNYDTERDSACSDNNDINYDSAGSSNNDINYDSDGSSNSDINHDTLSEEDDGDNDGNDEKNENDLNYDSDEEPKNKKETPSIQSANGTRK